MIDRLENKLDDYFFNVNSELLDNWFEDGIRAILRDIEECINSELDYYNKNYIEYAFECDLYGDYIIDENGRIFRDEPPKYYCNGLMFTSYAEMAEEYNKTHDEPIPVF